MASTGLSGPSHGHTKTGTTRMCEEQRPQDQVRNAAYDDPAKPARRAREDESRATGTGRRSPARMVVALSAERSPTPAATATPITAETPPTSQIEVREAQAIASRPRAGSPRAPAPAVSRSTTAPRADVDRRRDDGGERHRERIDAKPCRAQRPAQQHRDQEIEERAGPEEKDIAEGAPCELQ